MSLIQNRSSLLAVVATALLTSACGGSNALQSPLSPTAVTGSAAAPSGGAMQAFTADTTITALAKGAGRSGGDDGKKDGDDKGKNGSGGGSGSDDGRERSGDREPARQRIQLSGRVTAVAAAGLTVRGMDVSVVVTTVIRHGNRVLTLADVRVGNQAQVKGTLVGGVITASEIKVEDTDGKDEDDLARVELKGVVSGLASTLTCPVVTFSVGSVSVTTSAATVFSGALCTALLNGQAVEVKALRQLDGTLLAQRVGVGDDDDMDDANTAKGLTSAPSGTCPSLAFTVGVTPVTTSVTTAFHGVTCAQIAAGAVVKVEAEGTRMADGSLAATLVELD